MEVYSKGAAKARWTLLLTLDKINLQPFVITSEYAQTQVTCAAGVAGPGSLFVGLSAQDQWPLALPPQEFLKT